ncbi:hypothetical protein [Nocardioides pocheonensis]|nr:hypothetical protein [Nocardioides pocheonensis]
MEAFFVAVTVAVLLGFALWALLAARHLLTLTAPDPTQRRPGDD